MIWKKFDQGGRIDDLSLEQKEQKLAHGFVKKRSKAGYQQSYMEI